MKRETVRCPTRRRKRLPVLGFAVLATFIILLHFLPFVGTAGAAEVGEKNPHEPEMVLVPQGKFLMGSTDEEVEEAWKECRKKYPQCGRQWFAAAAPQHVVLLDAFLIDKLEVTNLAYRDCVDAGVCAPPKNRQLYEDRAYDDYPVVFVDWYQADTYCRWRGGRLPTEAEWEKAARGIEALTFPWGEEWAADEGRASFRLEKPQRAGMWPKGASPYGALDMAGNVWEWVQDWFDPEYYANSPYMNPPGPEAGARKVYRGGSWRSDLPIYIRTTHRNHFSPKLNDVFTGFRCARDASETDGLEATSPAAN